MRSARHAVGFTLAALAGLGSALGAQSAAPAVALSADSVEMAEVFELRVRVHVPPGSVVYFPDTLPATDDLESFAPVAWRAEREDGGAALTLTYPLISFGAGSVAIAGPEVLVVGSVEGAAGRRLPGGSLAGAWSDAPTGSTATSTTLAVPPRLVWVEPVHTAEDVLGGISPRPPDDVTGAGWGWPTVTLLLLFSSVLGGAVLTATREWRARRPPAGASPEGPLTPEQARLRAMAEIDRLLAAGPHPPERALALYTASSEAVRRYVERLDPAWGPHLTSTELMGRLGSAPRAADGVLQEMRDAERVKFGRLRPGAEAAAAHLRALGAWLRGAGEAER